ncbi:MAG: LuxR C-terminal-related transcriptional regulator [Thermoleophilia bacterium]
MRRLTPAILDTLARELREELDVERVSIARVDGRARTFRIDAWNGKGIFGTGTELPLDTSTQLGRAADGETFAAPDFAREPGWDRPTDRLMDALGFRSGCSVRVRGDDGLWVVSLSSVRARHGYDRRIDRVRACVRDLRDAPRVTVPDPGLTRREQDVLALLERGLRFKQIGRELGISETTAKGYASDLFRKLGVASRAEAVFAARGRGLL